MKQSFKKTFFTSLLAVLLVISNLIGLKLTSFFDLTISVNFLTYPFTFLCTLLIYNIAGKKSAYESILVSALIQIFMLITYSLTVSLGSQSTIPDMSSAVNELFKVKEINILASLLSFMMSHYLLIYIYENFKKCQKELLGVVIGLVGALFLNSTIYLIITLSDYNPVFVINMLLSNIIISLIMVVILTVMYYLLRENHQETVNIEKMKIAVDTCKNQDKAIDEIITSSKKSNIKTKKKTTVTESNKKKNTYNESNKKKKYVKKDSKKNVKKSTHSKQEE